jgi:hypothetical protein
MHAASASAQTAPDQLRPDEYDTVALIYNQELSELGERALYPICIDMPFGVHTGPSFDICAAADLRSATQLCVSLPQPRAGSTTPRTTHTDSAFSLINFNVIPGECLVCKSQPAILHSGRAYMSGSF